ncbi:restriction endonuclease subunit S [Maricurvus nonylphenolicus]|uniref:restriction endonuclease subunit S n=1 Tax=Maricurvus nonylphenolicus TaxID=1008307 RepID=UPI0036F333F2
MSELPKGWVDCLLDEISDVVTGKTPTKKNPEYFDGNIPFIKPGDVKNQGLILNTEQTLSELGAETVPTIPAGSVTVTCIGNLGRVALTKVKSATNQQINSVVVNKLVNNKFIYYYLMTLREWMEAEASSTTVTIINKGRFSKAPVSLPPLNEQTRIANKLDSLLAKVDAAQTRLERIPTLLKRFRQSVLAAATSGELTRECESSASSYYKKIESEIRNSNKLKKLEELSESEIELAVSLHGHSPWPRWKLYALEQLVDPNRGIPYGIVQTGDAQEEGIPTIRCGDVKPLSIRVNGLKKVSEEIESKYTRTRLKGREVLLAIRGTVGNAAVAGEELGSEITNISREVAMIPVRETVDPVFISMLLQSPGGFRCLAEKVRGVAQKGINLADVKRFVTPLPGLSEQKEIVRRVESLFAMADTVEKQYHDAKKRIDRLTQSILAKAFRGELVPQDPNDEPASELLKRIQAEREQQQTKPKRKTSTRKRKTTTKKKKLMKLAEAPETYLLDLLTQLGGEAQAETLWKQSELSIDDFYAKLKQEMATKKIIDFNPSSDPSLRKLKAA